MHLLIRFLANAAGLAAAGYIIKGFTLTFEPKTFLLIVLTFTLVNAFLRPVLKFLFAPLIVLTLGFFSLVINALILKALDIFFEGIMIEGLISLLVGTLLISVINLVVTQILKGLLVRHEVAK